MALNSRHEQRKPYQIMERRFLSVVVLAFLLPLFGVAGYRVLELPQPAPPVSVVAAAFTPRLPVVPKFKEFLDQFRKNDTITGALQRHGLSKQQASELVQATRLVWPHSRVIAGEEFQGNLYPSGEFHEFRYRIDSDRSLTVYRDRDGFVPLIKKLDHETRTMAVTGSIQDSLFASVTRAGEQPELAVDLSNIFAWDVDFYTDMQKGDTFRLLVEKKYLDGKFDGYGNILTAELTVGKKRLSAYRFQNELYDAEGKSLKKSLLKSPLKFAARISSRFSAARLHPILKIVRPHLGVDYAAPIGTPVAAVAAGTVIFAGVDGGFGNSVRVRHDIGGLETVYSHLAQILVRGGQRVAQGEHIGDVGATGLASLKSATASFALPNFNWNTLRTMIMSYSSL